MYITINWIHIHSFFLTVRMLFTWCVSFFSVFSLFLQISYSICCCFFFSLAIQSKKAVKWSDIRNKITKKGAKSFCLFVCFKLSRIRIYRAVKRVLLPSPRSFGPSLTNDQQFRWTYRNYCTYYWKVMALAFVAKGDGLLKVEKETYFSFSSSKTV